MHTERMATVKVIVSWLKYEVSVADLNHFYVSFDWPV